MCLCVHECVKEIYSNSSSKNKCLFLNFLCQKERSLRVFFPTTEQNISLARIPRDCSVCGEMRSVGAGLGNDNKKPKPKPEALRLCPGTPLYTTENLLTYVTHDLTHKLLEFTRVTVKVRLPTKY